MRGKDYRHDYERVYLLESRLKSSFTEDSKRYLNKDETKKIINHMITITYKKNYWGLKLMGIERDDLESVAKSFASIFYTKYYKKQKNEKAAYYALCRFLGQKLNNYICISNKKIRPVMEFEYTPENQVYLATIMAQDTKLLEINNEALSGDEYFSNLMLSANPSHIKKMERILTKKPKSPSSDTLIESCLRIYFEIDMSKVIYKKMDGVGFFLLEKSTFNELKFRIKKYPKTGIKKIGELLLKRIKIR